LLRTTLALALRRFGHQHPARINYGIAKMNWTTKALVSFVVLVHLMFFVLEAIFWMQPAIYSILLGFLDNPVSSDYPTQALTLRNLFINQGFYNLFLATTGLMGLALTNKEPRAPGFLLILVLCFCGFGAGIVLAFSTKAYVLAILQAVPAGAAFLRIYPLYRRSLAQNKTG
jgi:putative membrane protein